MVVPCNGLAVSVARSKSPDRTHPFCRRQEVVNQLAPLQGGMPGNTVCELLKPAHELAQASEYEIAHSYRLFSTNSGANRSPLMYSKRCLSGMGGTTHAGKFLTRCSRKKLKSWNRLRTTNGSPLKLGRLV